MNVNDTEIIWSILKKTGFNKTDVIAEADVILVVTCAIREGAESKIWNRLDYLKSLKRIRKQMKSKPALKVGLLGNFSAIYCFNHFDVSVTLTLCSLKFQRKLN